LLSAGLVIAPPATPAQAHLESHTNIRLGFDRCGAMTPQALQAFWNGTPLYTVGVYIGGQTATKVGCFIPDRNWVTAVRNQGWGIVFIWDGLQAPCSPNTEKMSKDPNTAYQQGRQAATDAYLKFVNGLGGDEHPTVFYLDLEGNYKFDSTCTSDVNRNAVNNFIRGWVSYHAAAPRDYSGMYSSSSAAIKGMVQDKCWTWNTNCPNYVWMANYNLKSSVWGDSNVSDDYWWAHTRLHQFRGGHSHTYNGVTLNPVDDDCNLGGVAGGILNEDPSSHNDNLSQVKAMHPDPTCGSH